MRLVPSPKKGKKRRLRIFACTSRQMSVSSFLLRRCCFRLGESRCVRIDVLVSVGCRLRMPLAFLIVAFLPRAELQAGCVYPTHVESSSTNNRFSAESLGVLAKQTSSHSGKPCSCSGPTCSRRPFAPAPPISVFDHLRIQDWGCPIFRPRLAPPTFADSYRDADRQRPVRRVSAIFHPPRFFTYSACV